MFNFCLHLLAIVTTYMRALNVTLYRLFATNNFHLWDQIPSPQCHYCSNSFLVARYLNRFVVIIAIVPLLWLLLRALRFLWRSVQPMGRLTRVVVRGRRTTFMNTHNDWIHEIAHTHCDIGMQFLASCMTVFALIVYFVVLLKIHSLHCTFLIVLARYLPDHEERITLSIPSRSSWGSYMCTHACILCFRPLNEVGFTPPKYAVLIICLRVFLHFTVHGHFFIVAHCFLPDTMKTDQHSYTLKFAKPNNQSKPDVYLLL